MLPSVGKSLGFLPDSSTVSMEWGSHLSSYLTGSPRCTAGCTRDRTGASVIGEYGASTQANRPSVMATQSGLGYAERRTWPEGYSPGHLMEMWDVSRGLGRIRR